MRFSRSDRSLVDRDLCQPYGDLENLFSENDLALFDTRAHVQLLGLTKKNESEQQQQQYYLFLEPV